LKRKLEIDRWFVLGAIAALYKLICKLKFEFILALLAVVGLIAVFKNDNPSLWTFPLLFGGCAFLLTYRRLGKLGLLKRRP